MLLFLFTMFKTEILNLIILVIVADNAVYTL